MNTKQIAVCLVLTFIAILISFTLTELTVSYIVGFPSLGIQKIVHIYPNDKFMGNKAYENVYKPHTRFFHEEDGFHIYRYNNVGLPGVDINMYEKKIFVLGNSYIEARAINPEKLATSVIQDLLHNSGYDYSVFNLGKGGHIPSSAYYRLKYWKTLVKPDVVILVLEEYMIGNVARTNELIDDTSPKALSYHEVKGKDIYGAKICTLSAVANLFRSGYKHAKNNNSEEKASTQKIKHSDGGTPLSVKEKQEKAISNIQNDIKCFHRLEENFYVFSLLNDEMNETMGRFCEKEGIGFGCDSGLRQTKQFLINRKGHFNEKGHQALGIELSKFIIEKIATNQHE